VPTVGRPLLRQRRSIALTRAWRRALIAVSIAIIIALGLGLAVLVNDMVTLGMNPQTCYVRSACNRQNAAPLLTDDTFDMQHEPMLHPDITLTIAHHSVHEVVHIDLAADDALAQSYLGGRLSLTGLANAIGWVSVDGDDGFDDYALHATHLSLTPARFVIDLENDLYHTDIAEEPAGRHQLVFGFSTRSTASVTLDLDGFGFINSAAFSRAPQSVDGTTSARWTGIQQGAGITVRTVSTSAAAPYGALRTAIENAGDVTGWPAVGLKLFGMLWYPLGLLVVLRCLPRRNRPVLRAPAMVYAATSTAVAFGTAFFLAYPLVSVTARPALALITIAGALGFLAFAFAVTGLPAALRAFLITAGLLFGSFFVSNIDFAGRALFVAPAFALALALIAAGIVLAPRALARATGAGTTLEPAVWAGTMGAVALAIGASQLVAKVLPQYVIAYPGQSATSLIAIAASVVPGLFGFIAFILGRGLDPRAPRNVAPWAVTVLLTLSSIGVTLDLGVPLATFAGLLFIPLIALRSSGEIRRLGKARVVANGPDDDPSFDLAVLRADVASACSTLRKLQENFVTGTISRSDHDAKAADLQNFIDDSRRQLSERDKDDLLSSLFTSFPFARPLAAARSGAICGAVVGLIVVLLGLPGVINQYQSSPMLFVGILAVVVSTVLRYALSAAVFILFLPFLRGNTGTTKGFIFAATLALATVPAFSLYMPVEQALLGAAPIVLFYPLVGAIFDALALRKHSESLSVAQIFGLAGLGNFAAIATVFVSAIGSAVTGELHRVATSLVDAALKIPAGH
jgi:hypothetical protein